MFTSAIPPTGHPRQSGRPQWVSMAGRPATVGVHSSQAGHSGHPVTVRLEAVGVHDSQAGCSGHPRQSGRS